MNPIHGLLALSLSALAAAGSPLPPAGSTPSATDDLIEMARSQIALERLGNVHFAPEEIMLVEDDIDLSGVLLLDSFFVLNGAKVTATDDLTIICRNDIVVDGKIVGIPNPDDGTDITLKAFDVLFLRGCILGGEGTDGTAGKGGGVFLSGERTTLLGEFKAARGGTADVGYAGDGGDAVVYGEYDSRCPSRFNLVGGNGGYPGGYGGNSGWFVESQEVLTQAFGAPLALIAPSFAFVAASLGDGPMGPPGGGTAIPCGDAGGGSAGTDFTDQVVGSAGTLAAGANGADSGCCVEGGDGGSGEGTEQIATDGDDGDLGHTSENATIPYNGGDGGEGGGGGSAFAKSGGDGGDASDCCGPDCDNPVGKKGGDAGKPQYAKGGDGGDGGMAGFAVGPCVDGIDGLAGEGGDTQHGIGGNGGSGGDGTLLGGGGGAPGGTNLNSPIHGPGCSTGGHQGDHFDEFGEPIIPTPCGEGGPNQGDPGSISYPPGTGLFPGGLPGDPGGICA